MKKLFGLIIVILVSYWMVRPLFGPGYFPMHDDTQVARVVEMGKALREGQFPVRWVSDLGYGYGYPIFNFYGPLPYYIGGFFYALGVSGLVATKLMMGLGLVLAGVTMYIAISDIAGISGGILAAAFYMYAPYHAVDAYVRGAVGEYYALIFLPLIFWGFWRKKILIGALGIAGLIISHTILGYAGMIFVGLALLALRVQKQALILVLLGLGLSAFFWLPAMTEMKYTNVGSMITASADYHDHFVCLPQLWNSMWGYGGSASGCLDGLSFKVGKLHLALGLLALVVAIKKRKYFVVAGASIFLLSVFFMLSVSVRIWEMLPLFAFVQYPWRFLAFAIFGVSITVSGIVFVIKNSYVRGIIGALSVGILLFIEIKLFMPQYQYSRPASEFETMEDIRWRVSKISDEYLPPNTVKPTKSDQVLRDTIAKSDFYTREIVQETDTYKKFSFLSGQNNSVVINVVYFPGWHYIVNATEVTPEVRDGLPMVTVPSELTVVQMKFRDTPVRTVGNIISLVSLGVFIFLYDRNNKKTIS